MNIIEIDSIPSLSKLKNKEQFINQLIQQVMIICREDKSFSINKKIEKLNVYRDTLKKKDFNLQNLLEKSKKIREGFDKEISEIDEDNTKLKNKLIEYLGGQIWI